MPLNRNLALLVFAFFETGGATSELELVLDSESELVLELETDSELDMSETESTMYAPQSFGFHSIWCATHMANVHGWSCHLIIKCANSTKNRLENPGC